MNIPVAVARPCWWPGGAFLSHGERGNWRMTFTFENGDAVLVDYLDYQLTGIEMNRMFNLPHPGETLKEDVLPALGLNVTDAAAQLGVTRAAFFAGVEWPRCHFA